MKNCTDKIKFSLIIPVYNVELYVEKCLLSCLAQDIPINDYEIIIINDGSEDRSIDIVCSIAKNYSNVKIITQENKGLSNARNKGLSLAKGLYIWFIDSDDSIHDHCLGGIWNTLSYRLPDALIIGAADIFMEKPISRQDFSILSKPDNPGIELLSKSFYQACVPFTIYNREFLIKFGLKFKEGIFHEDSEFTPRAYYYAKLVSIYPEVIYYVNKNPNSITRSLNHKKAYDRIIVANSLSIFMRNIPKKYSNIFNNIISLIINESLNSSYKMDKKSALEFNIFLHTNRILFKHLRGSTIVKYVIEGYLFVILPKFYLHTYKALQLLNPNKLLGRSQ